MLRHTKAHAGTTSNRLHQITTPAAIEWFSSGLSAVSTKLTAAQIRLIPSYCHAKTKGRLQSLTTPDPGNP